MNGVSRKENTIVDVQSIILVQQSQAAALFMLESHGRNEKHVIFSLIFNFLLNVYI